jgi:hypothetical protein
MPASVQLRITEGIAKGKVFTFAAHDTFFLGRHPDCHVHLPDDTFVSRHHFILEACPPQACVRDLGSRNGTYVNGRKVGGRKEGESPEEGARRAYPEVTSSTATASRWATPPSKSTSPKQRSRPGHRPPLPRAQL